MGNKGVISLEEISKLKSRLEQEIIATRVRESELHNALAGINDRIQQLTGQLELLKTFEESCRKKEAVGGNS